MLLNILIPTFNRSEGLVKNLKQIDEYITKLGIGEEVRVIVSDNGSDEIENRTNIKNVESFHNKVKYIHHQQNQGYEKNVLYLLGQSNAEYSMMLGDDDYLSYDLFSLIIKYLQTRKYRAIACNFYVVDINGNRIYDDPRDPISKEIEYNKGDIVFSLKGHQLSCLIFKTDGVLNYYNRKVRSNLYPTVAFMGYSISKGKGLHITRFPYQNTQLKKKNFDYSFDGLLEEICICMECMPYDSTENRVKTYKALLKSERDRFVNQNTFFHPIRFIHIVDHEYRISNTLKKMIKDKFVLEWIKMPSRFIVIQILRILKRR